MQTTFKERVTTILIGLVVLFSILSFTPFVNEISGLYGLLSNGLLVILAITTIMVISINRVINNGFLLVFFFVLLVNIIQTLVFYAAGMRIRWADFLSLIYIFLFISIGYCLPIQKEKWDGLIKLFSFLSVSLGVLSVFYYLGSISLLTDMYAIEAKNQIGQVVAMGCMALVIICFRFPIKKRWFWLMVMIVGIVSLFVIRCRTAMLAFLICFFIYLFKVAKNTTNKVWIFILPLVLMLVFLVFQDKIFVFFEEAFVGNKNIDDINSLSTGRMERNIQGLSFVLQHPFYGELKGASDIPQIHNYIINRLTAYGIFSFPYLFLYFLVLVKVIKSWKGDNTNVIGGLLLTIPFISSLLEPGAPFGPGMVQVFPYLLLGMSMKSTYV